MLRAEGEGDNRGWDGCMASLTQWTWVWVDSGSWWWTGRPGVLRIMGSQRVGNDWETELTFTCWVFLCLFFLFRLLCLWCPFCRLKVHDSSLLCSLLPWVGWLFNFSSLGEPMSVFQWMELDLFFQIAMRWPVVNFGVSMELAWLWVACLLMLRAVLLFYQKISMVCLPLEVIGSWVELGFTVGMEGFGWWALY